MDEFDEQQDATLRQRRADIAAALWGADVRLEAGHGYTLKQREELVALLQSFRADES